MKRLFLVLAIVALAGCASVRKVESGTVVVGERLSFQIEGDWNHLDFPGTKPAQIWTMEGVTVDELLIYSGIRDGQAMHPEEWGNSPKKNILFRKSMPLEEVVSMFEAVLTRDDSTFNMTRVEPYVFAGKKGIRFEYDRIRKLDSVQQRGIAYALIDKSELFALIYQAPRLTFFPRHRERVESIAKSVQVN
jgi:uncharacterized protein YceK